MVRGWCDRVKSWYGAGVTMSWYTAGVTILFMVYIVDAIWYAAGVILRKVTQCGFCVHTLYSRIHLADFMFLFLLYHK
jgi:hypothetical protein